MKFAGVNYFHLLWILLALIVFYSYTFKKYRRLLSNWGDFSLVSRLINEVSVKKKKIKILFFLASVFLLIIALAQPQWGYHWEELKRKGIDIIICLDTSKSMLADDIKPNRLEAAEREIEDLLKILNGDRIGLIIFAGTSFLQCPLTLDYGAVRLLLDSVNTDTIPQPGTDIGGAIQKAVKAFEKGSKKHQAIILITDGEDHSNTLEKAITSCKNEGIPIFVVGMGSKEGTPIPTTDQEGNRIYLKDRKGDIVLSQLDDLSLKKLALQTGGAYIDANAGALEKIYQERISKIEQKELESTKRKIYENRFQWPLVLALLLLMISAIISEKSKLYYENNISA